MPHRDPSVLRVRRATTCGLTQSRFRAVLLTRKSAFTTNSNNATSLQEPLIPRKSRARERVLRHLCQIASTDRISFETKMEGKERLERSALNSVLNIESHEKFKTL